MRSLLWQAGCAGAFMRRTERLLEPVRVQGFDTTPMGAIYHSVSHFVGHSQEVSNITRFQLRERYVFKFVPKTKEQGA